MQIHADPRKALKTILVFCASVCLAVFAPAAVAQRGGGGHGGGGSHGGGHAGGHGGGAAATHVSGGTHVSAGRGYAGGSSYRSARGGSAGGSAGFSPSRFVSSGHPSAEERYGNNYFVSQSQINGRSYTVTGTRAYPAGNRLWADPDQQAHVGTPTQAARPVAMPVAPRPIAMPIARPVALPNPIFRAPLAGGIRVGAQPAFHPIVGGVIPAPAMPRPVNGRPVTFAARSGAALTDPHGPYGGMIFPPFHPFGHFHHGFGFGYGFGFRQCFVINPCGFGFGGGYGLFGGYGLYGYGNGWFYPVYDEEEATEPGVPETYPTVPDFTAEYYDSLPPYLPPAPENEEAQAQTGPLIELVLNDQTVFPVMSYWLKDNRLYYITTYNIQTSIPLSDLDLQKTVDMNYKRGVTFSLTPQPPQTQEKPQQPDTPQPPLSQKDSPKTQQLGASQPKSRM